MTTTRHGRGRRPSSQVPRPAVTTAHVVLSTTLTAVLDRHRITQSALAAAAGYSEKHVSQMRTGAARGSLAAWENLIDAAVGLAANDTSRAPGTVLDIAIPLADLTAAAAREDRR